MQKGNSRLKWGRRNKAVLTRRPICFGACSVSGPSCRECDVNKGHGSSPTQPCVSVSYPVDGFISEFTAAENRQKIEGEMQQHRCIETACYPRVVMAFKWHA